MKRLCAAMIAFSAFAKTTTPGPIPPPAPKEEWDAHLYQEQNQVVSFHGEFLFWKTFENALDFALQMTSPAWGPANDYAQGRYQNGTYDIEPGFRVSASFFRAPKYWEVWGSYTRLTARGDASAGKPDAINEFLTGTWPQIVPNPLTNATSHLHLNYNVADMFVDRYFLPNPHLRLRVLGGITGTWMDQNWQIEYADAFNNKTSIRNKWKFGGAGLRFGTMVDWFWTWDLYFTAKGTLAACVGSYVNHSKQTTNYPISSAYNTSLPVRNIRYADTRAIANAQLLVGPSYQKNINQYRLEVFVGYELNAWLNVQEVYRSTSGTPADGKETLINTGTLGLQGVTARVTFDF